MDKLANDYKFIEECKQFQTEKNIRAIPPCSNGGKSKTSNKQSKTATVQTRSQSGQNYNRTNRIHQALVQQFNSEDGN